MPVTITDCLSEKNKLSAIEFRDHPADLNTDYNAVVDFLEEEH